VFIRMENVGFYYNGPYADPAGLIEDGHCWSVRLGFAPGSGDLQPAFSFSVRALIALGSGLIFQSGLPRHETYAL